MRTTKYHIYNNVDGEVLPLCYFETDDAEEGKVLDFDTEEAANRFIESAVESGDRSEEFFEGIFICESVEYCDFGYIDATNLYIGIDGKLYELGDTRGLE